MLSARNADVLTAGSHVSEAVTEPHPTGPAGKVAGTAPTQAGHFVTSGSTGSPWPGNPHDAPATTTGKVFFTTGTGTSKQEEWVCSGSAVNSNGKDMVFTAGHCVYGSLGGEVPGEGWHGKWAFVPDYSNGSAPYGVWTARTMTTLTSYVNTGGAMTDEGADMAAVDVNTNSGRHLVNVVGGQGFAWNWSANLYVYDFGYPAASPFNGMTLQYCNGYEFSWSVSSTMGLACNFTGGSSGGPWLESFNGTTGYVNGVNDFGYSSIPGYIFSAYFGSDADAVYNAAANG